MEGLKKNLTFVHGGEGREGFNPKKLTLIFFMGFRWGLTNFFKPSLYMIIKQNFNQIPDTKMVTKVAHAIKWRAGCSYLDQRGRWYFVDIHPHPTPIC